MPPPLEPIGGTDADRRSPQQRGHLEALLLESLPAVERAVRIVAMRNRMRTAEAQDLASEARLALVANDYAALARFQGRSSLVTYLVTLVHRLFSDRQRRILGRWHPSSVAERLGPVAVRLELLLIRDGLPFGDAVRRLRQELDVSESDEELRHLAARLPSRFRAREVSAPAAMGTAVSAACADPEAQVLHRDVAQAVQSRLADAVRSMEPEDRIILRMRFERDMTLADVARSLGLDEKSVYRRMDKALARAREVLTSGGLDWREAERSIELGHCDLRFSAIFGDAAKSPREDPSTEVGP
jgi:RNA polymerase sigma factor (sigma-70 family)